MKTKIKATIVIPSKKESEDSRRIIKEVNDDKTPMSQRNIKKTKRKKVK